MNFPVVLLGVTLVRHDFVTLNEKDAQFFFLDIYIILYR
jgi:hypothetical protein